MNLLYRNNIPGVSDVSIIDVSTFSLIYFGPLETTVSFGNTSFNPNLYYNKTEVDEILQGSIDVSGYTSFDYVDGSLSARDISINWIENNTYNKTYIDASLNFKADLNHSHNQDSSIGVLYVDIAQNTLNIDDVSTTLNNHTHSQDISIGVLYTEIDDINSYQLIQDASILNAGTTLGNGNAITIDGDNSINFGGVFDSNVYAYSILSNQFKIDSWDPSFTQRVGMSLEGNWGGDPAVQLYALDNSGPSSFLWVNPGENILGIYTNDPSDYYIRELKLTPTEFILKNTGSIIADASAINYKNDVSAYFTDRSLIDLGYANSKYPTFSYVDGSINNHVHNQDSSIGVLYVDIAQNIVDISDVSTRLNIQDSSISDLYSDVDSINSYQIIQDASIASGGAQDASIGNLYSTKLNTDASAWGVLHKQNTSVGQNLLIPFFTETGELVTDYDGADIGLHFFDEWGTTKYLQTPGPIILFDGSSLLQISPGDNKVAQSYQETQDAAIILNQNDIDDVSARLNIQDSSIGDLYSDVIQNTTDISDVSTRLDNHTHGQDASIGDLYSSKADEFIETADISTGNSLDVSTDSYNNMFYDISQTGDVSINLFESLTDGLNITFVKTGATGTITFIGDGSANVYSKESLTTLVDQYGMVTCITKNSDWFISGDLT